MKHKQDDLITRSYRAEVEEIDALNLRLFPSALEIVEMMNDESVEFGEIMSRWMNSSYNLLRELESKLCALEVMIAEDARFNEAPKARFKKEFVSPTMTAIERGRELDRYIMFGKRNIV